MPYKVSIIGAGAVGATLGQRIVESALADVALVDVAASMAKGKALDIIDASPLVGHEREIAGSGDYKDIQGSDIVVITAGLARKPGMTREDLIAKNAEIVKEVSGNIKLHSPGSIVIVVTNPLDAMTYLAYRTTGFKREKVFGMAGVLDGARFIQLVARELGVARSTVTTYILGSHGDTMVPVLSKTYINKKKIENLIPRDRLDAIIKRTRDRGAEIVSLLETGSAYYSPGAATFKMVKAILNDLHETMTVSSYLDGEYGLNNIAIGVPCRIGRAGIEKIIEIEMTPDEKAAFLKSAHVIRDSIENLPA